MAKESKGKKIGRNINHQSKVYYATDRLRRNRKRAMRRHLRRNPGDFRTATLYEERFGEKVVSLGLSGKGRRLLKRKK
jgi:hypothetical protein